MASKGVILVTGANTGLGFQIIRALYGGEAAYSVLLGGRSLQKVEQAIKSVADEFPASRSKLWPLQIDIEDDVSIQRVFDEVKTQFGKLDVLINNAGMYSSE